MATKEGSETAGMGRCPPPCGKVRYSTRKVAKLAVSRIRGKGNALGASLRAYQCDTSEWWHATSWPASSMAWKRERDTTSQDA